MVISGRSRQLLALSGRVTYGSVLAFMAMNGFIDEDEQVAYAESKGVPAPELLVPLSHGVLLFGSLGIIFGRLRRVTASAVAVFLVIVTPQMHDFWNVEGQEQQQAEMINFLKNVALFGAALAFLLGREPAKQ